LHPLAICLSLPIRCVFVDLFLVAASFFAATATAAAAAAFPQFSDEYPSSSDGYSSSVLPTFYSAASDPFGADASADVTSSGLVEGPGATKNVPS
jgi:hypothetical protein